MTENIPATPTDQKSLDEMGVPKELAEHAKLMWILSGVISILGPLIFGYLVKKEGQDQNPWFQDQVRKCWLVAIIAFIGYWCIVGWVFAIILGYMGMDQIGRGKDPHVLIVSPKGFQG
jgi:hypothetical protein